MPTAVQEVHAFDAARKAGREPFKVKDLGLAEFGRKGSASPSTRCPD